MERPLSGQKPAIALPEGATDTHMHAYVPGFPSLPGGPANPEGRVGPEEYRRLMDWLGIDRVVVVQGNAQQMDNANLLAAVAALGPIARAVAAVAPDESEAELQRLHDAGVRGARIMDLSGGAVGLSALPAVAERVAPFGWTTIVQFDGSRLLDHLPALEAIPGRYVIDHHAKFLSAPPTEAHVDALRRLIDRGNCWFKFCACYESSKVGGPDYGDIAPLARRIAEESPERVIWGTNWPHNSAKTPAEYPDDAALVDTVLGWAPASALRKILVESPAELFDF